MSRDWFSPRDIIMASGDRPILPEACLNAENMLLLVFWRVNEALPDTFDKQRLPNLQVLQPLRQFLAMFCADIPTFAPTKRPDPAFAGRLAGLALFVCDGFDYQLVSNGCSHSVTAEAAFSVVDVLMFLADYRLKRPAEHVQSEITRSHRQRFALHLDWQSTYFLSNLLVDSYERPALGPAVYA